MRIPEARWSKACNTAPPVQAGASTHAWVVYPDLDPLCDQVGSLGRGGPGLTILHANGLEGLIGNRMIHFSPCGRGPYISPIGRYTGGLTTLRERASEVTVAVGEGDPVDVETRLPAEPYERCGQ